MTSCIPCCEGIITVKKSRAKDISGIEVVYTVPENFVNPRSLRRVLMSAGRAPPSASARIELAVRLATAVSCFLSIGFNHGNIVPETILIFDHSRDRTAQDHMTDYSEGEIGFPLLIGVWLRTPIDRQLSEGYLIPYNIRLYERTEDIFQDDSRSRPLSTRSDIYSLGVSLLEIGLWKSFYSTRDSESFQAWVDDKLVRALSWEERDILVNMANEMLPPIMGRGYTNAVVSCLEWHELIKDDPASLDSSSTLRFNHEVSSCPEYERNNC